MKLRKLFLVSIFLCFIPLELNAETLYKIKFGVTDDYGTNLSGVKFQFFDSEKEAREALDKVKKGTFKENADVLTSKNGIVVSDYVSYNKQKYFIQINTLPAYEPNYNIYNFMIHSKDKYLTQKVTENNKTVYIKNILSRSICLSNKYRIKLTQTDVNGAKISGVIYNVYDNINDASIAESQFLKNKKVTHPIGLLEILSPTNKLGVTVSSKYYSTGTYYIVQTNSVSTSYLSNTLSEIKITRAEKGDSIEKVYTDKTNYYYVKKVGTASLSFKLKK